MGSEFFKSTPIAAHSCMTNLVKEDNSSKGLALQPVAAHSYQAILVWGANSSKFLPLQPIVAHF